MVVRQLFTRIDKEYGEGSLFLFQQVQQREFLQSVGFPAQAFDPVPVYRLLEIAAAGAKSGLDRRTTRPWLGPCRAGPPRRRRGLGHHHAVRRGRLPPTRPGKRLKQVKNLEGKERKAPPFPENPIDPLAALEFFVLFPGELTADDTL
jgi:hypothetical protein